MLLAGMRCTRPASVATNSAKPPGAEPMTRSPGLMPATTAPTASTSPEHSRPTRAPPPPTLPCWWPEATMRSARLRLEARTRIKTSFGFGSGFGRSRTSTLFSPTTAAFMVVPPIYKVFSSPVETYSTAARAPPGSTGAEIAEGSLFPPVAVDGVKDRHVERFSQRKVAGDGEGVFLGLKSGIDQLDRRCKALLYAPCQQRSVVHESIELVGPQRLEAVLQGRECAIFDAHLRQRVLGRGAAQRA